MVSCMWSSGVGGEGEVLNHSVECSLISSIKGQTSISDREP